MSALGNQLAARRNALIRTNVSLSNGTIFIKQILSCSQTLSRLISPSVVTTTGPMPQTFQSLRNSSECHFGKQSYEKNAKLCV